MAIKTKPKADPTMKYELERFARNRLVQMAKDDAHYDRIEKLAAALPAEKSIGSVKIVGRPHSGKKVVSLRIDPDIIEAFRATGPGWQARMNDALRKEMP